MSAEEANFVFRSSKSFDARGTTGSNESFVAVGPIESSIDLPPSNSLIAELGTGTDALIGALVKEMRTRIFGEIIIERMGVGDKDGEIIVQ